MTTDPLMEELIAAQKQCDETNPFTSASRSLSAGLAAERRREQAELALWEAGRCCTECEGGRCGGRAVRWAREEKLVEQGMGRRNARALAKVCEHSEQWKDIESARQILADSGGASVETVVEAILNQGDG